MCFGIFFIYKMHVVGTDKLDIILLRQLYDFFIGYLLHAIRLVIGSRHCRFMTLKLQIEVASENSLVPLDGFFRLLQLSLNNLSGDFTRNTRRTDYQPFVIFFQFYPVGTRTHIVSLCPSLGHQLYQIVISFFILCQHHQVITALVRLTVTIEHPSTGHIHFTTEDRLEQLLLGSLQLLLASFQFSHRVFAFHLPLFQSGDFLLQVLYLAIGLAVLLIDIVEKFLNAEHVAMIGHGDSLHTVGHRLIHQTGDRSLSVENRILSMYM